MNITLARHAQRDLGLSAPQAAAAALHSSPPLSPHRLDHQQHPQECCQNVTSCGAQFNGAEQVKTR